MRLNLLSWGATAQHLLRNTSGVISAALHLHAVNEWMAFPAEPLHLKQRHLSGVFFKYSFLMSFIVLLPSPVTLFLNFDPDYSPFATFVPKISGCNCFFSDCFLCFFSFFFFSRAFADAVSSYSFGSLSPRLCRLHWSSLGLMPRPQASVTSMGPAHKQPLPENSACLCSPLMLLL